MSKILIVDDTVDHVKMVAMALNQRGYETISAYNGDEGLTAAHAEQPDLVLVDQVMPGMSGWDLFHHLRSGEITAHIPVIMVTAFSKDYHSEHAEALELGMEDYLTKPVDLHHLLKRVAAVLAYYQGE